MKIGLVGLDTSHVPAILKVLNKKKSENKISSAFSGGSKLCSVSYNRVDKFTKEVSNKFKIPILSSIEEVAENSDAIIITSCDGRQHLEQFKILAKYQKPVFIDKPFTCSLSDAKEIVKLSEKLKTPIFSSSSLRYYNGINGLQKGKNIHFLEVYGKAKLLNDYPGYFWYGIHSAEILFHIFGPGCKNIQVFPNENIDMIVSNWKDGRKGTLYLHRYKNLKPWGVRLFTDKNMIDSIGTNKPDGFHIMLVDIIKFFKTGKSPISNIEMLEVVAFLEAANESRKNGKSIDIQI